MGTELWLDGAGAAEDGAEGVVGVCGLASIETLERGLSEARTEMGVSSNSSAMLLGLVGSLFK